MKPLQTVPLTDEDLQIHQRDVGRNTFSASFLSGRRFAMYRMCDEYDAGLMRGIQRLRREGWRTSLSTWFREGRENVERAIGGRLL